MPDYSCDLSFFLFQLTISFWMVHFSYNSYNLTISQFLSFLQFLAYEVVFLCHLRNSTGPKSIFGSVRLFFEKFFSPKGPTFNFLIFLDRMDFEKSQMVPPFSFFGIVRLFFEKKFHERVPNSPVVWHFEVLLVFLSLRYGADLGRSRLVFSRRFSIKGKMPD